MVGNWEGQRGMGRGGELVKQRRHASVLGNAMLGKDTAFGAESDLRGQLLGQGQAL